MCGLLTLFFFLPVRLSAWLVLASWFPLQLAYSTGAGPTDADVGEADLAHVLGLTLGAALSFRLCGSERDRKIARPRYGRYG